MQSPAERLYIHDLASAEFRAGASKGLWGEAEAEVRPPSAAWPNVFFFLAAAPRQDAPDRYYVSFDLTGYRNDPPTGIFWDPQKKTTLAFDKRPKGKPGSRVEKVFRTDWENGRAFYHPFDRVAASSHAEWRQNMPSKLWTPSHTIVDCLAEYQALLTSGDYIGI
jgi:hypothetical protein